MGSADADPASLPHEPSTTLHLTEEDDDHPPTHEYDATVPSNLFRAQQHYPTELQSRWSGESSGDLKFGSLNVNGLDYHKLGEILWFMLVEKVDILALIDTHTPEARVKGIAARTRQALGPNSRCFAAPLAPGLKGELRVWGQIIIVNHLWGPCCYYFRADGSRLGALTSLRVKTLHHHLLILNTYWPGPASADDPAKSVRRRDRLTAYIQPRYGRVDPLEFLQTTIFKIAIRFRKSEDRKVFLTGDFNQSWTNSSTPLRE